MNYKGINQFPKVKINRENDEHIGEFMGLFAGDGSVWVSPQYQHRVRLHFNTLDIDFAKELEEEVLLLLFGKSPTYIERTEHRLILRYYSKEIHSFIKEYLTWDPNERKSYSVHLKSRNHSREFIIGFIRGSIDSDGYYTEKEARFASVSKPLIDDIMYCLDELNIVHSCRSYKDKRPNRREIWHIRVFRSEMEKVHSWINPRNKRMRRAGNSES